MLMILRMFEVDNINLITTHLLQVIHTRLEAESMRKHGVWLYNNLCLHFSYGWLRFRVLKYKRKIQERNWRIRWVSWIQIIIIQSRQGWLQYRRKYFVFCSLLKAVWAWREIKFWRISLQISTEKSSKILLFLLWFRKLLMFVFSMSLEFLVNEGHAYSTIDNDHFKATDSL